MDEKWFLFLAGVPVLGGIAQLLAWWTRLPSILLLLLFGIFLGRFVNPDELLQELAQEQQIPSAEMESSQAGEGTNEELAPDSADTPSRGIAGGARQTSFGAHVLFPVISIAVAVILFEGGLSLRFNELRHAGGPVFRIVTLGALATWGITTLAAWLLLELNWRVATLLGAILVVTGPTVVVPLLRYIRPHRQIGSVVKWEGIVIDPVGAVLAVLVFEQLFSQVFEAGSARLLGPFTALLFSVVIGIGLGWLSARALTWLLQHFWIPDFLHGFSVLATAIGTFAISNYLQPESGLVTVTAMGVFLANQKRVSIDHVVEFKENVGVFLLSCLFIVLGSRLDPMIIWELGWPGVAFLASVILIVRPAAISLSTIRSRLNWKERAFLSFLAPRGIVAAAVASVFSLKILTLASGDGQMSEIADDVQKLVPLTFLVIVGTVAVYGLGAAPLARWLGLANANPQGILFAGASAWVRELALVLHQHGFPVILIDTNYRNVAAAKMAGIRAYCISILSDHAHEETDLSGVGRFLALTSNDEVNVLACSEYQHLFGRMNVYQLPPRGSSEGNRASLTDQLSARLLFTEDWNEDRFRAAYDRGYRIKATSLTESFGWDAFREMYGDDFVVLMTIQEDTLNIDTVEKPIEPQADQTLIALVKEPEHISPPTREQTESQQAPSTASEGENEPPGEG